MIPPKTISLRKFKKLLSKYGIQFEHGGKHLLFISEKRIIYPIPNMKEGEDVERAYVNAARRKFGLAPEDGISHEEFYKS